jgi:acyl phosphate:glycerol-3-phosphate acyltransferase
MPFTFYFAVAVVGYLLGSIPFGYLLVRYVRREDIREVGSGNIGATNVLRSGSKGLSILTLLLDTAKGSGAVLLGGMLANRFGAGHVDAVKVAALAGLCALLGHVFPVWLGFKGGKGVATGFGVFLALVPLAALGSVLVFVVVFALSRYVSLASILGAASLPLIGWWLERPMYSPWFSLMVTLAPVIIIVKHHQNIRRLLSGTEYRFGKAKGSAA